MKSVVVMSGFGLLLGALWAVPAGAQLSATQLKCQKSILSAASRYGSAVQRTIRKSIESNAAAKSSLCNGGFACIGGSKHGKVCVTNSDCGSSGPIPGCYPNGAKGLAGKLASAMVRLRKNVERSCTNAGLTPADVGFPTSLCPAPISGSMTFDDVIDCVSSAAAGDLDGAKVAATFAEPLSRATGLVTVAPPTDVCGLTLTSVLQIGVLDDGNTVGQSGPTANLEITGCSGNLCDTAGTIPVGNLSAPPIEVAMDALSFCLVTRLGDAGNGTSQVGQIDLSTGFQSSYAPIATDVHAGPCPKCVGNLCDSGPNAGQACLTSGGPDVGCLPTTSSRFATIPNPLDLSTDSKTLSQVPGKPGICGFCSATIAIGCQVDDNCPATETCTYAATQPGFHGDAETTSVSVEGRPGPYTPQLAGLFCTGRTNNALVDFVVTGLPGPVRYVQQRLNAFEFP